MRLTYILFNQNIKKASSLILLKPKVNTTEYEVLMLKRPKQGTFSGMTVFPGGAVDKADNEENFQLLNTKSQIKERPSELTQFKLSSIRETFEETGILITDKQPPLTQDELTKYRAEIINQPSDFINFLNEFNLTPQIDNLHAVSRWITPAYMKRRFDTVFFAHILNGKEQLASLNNSDGYQEAVQLNWETPKDWLLQQSSEEVDFMPPQFYFCQLLNNNLTTLKTLQDHLNYNNSAKSTTEETMLSGYLPNHIKIETSNIDLTAYNISLPPDYNLFYTILPGDSQYDKLQNSVPFSEDVINCKFDGNLHRVLGIRNKMGHMKMLKLLTNLKVRKGKFEFVSSN